MKLNLGCGDFPLTGYQNVDIRDLPGVDWVADVRKLPTPQRVVERIYAGHVIEHLGPDEAVQAIRDWWDILTPGGDLTIVIPDVDKALMLKERGDLSAADFLLIVGGDQSIPEMHHKSAWTC